MASKSQGLRQDLVTMFVRTAKRCGKHGHFLRLSTSHSPYATELRRLVLVPLRLSCTVVLCSCSPQCRAIVVPYKWVELILGRIVREAWVAAVEASCTLMICAPLLDAATEQVRAIVVSDESVREAKIVPGVRVATTAAGFGPAGRPVEFSVEGVFIAQLHTRAVLLNDGFQVILDVLCQCSTRRSFLIYCI